MEYLLHIGVLCCIYAILALALNLVVGFTGLLSIAQVGFYGIGAYATAILMTDHGWNFFPAMAIGIIVSGAVAIIIGVVLSKFRGDYYALASLGFTTIMYSVFLNWDSLTRGPLGIPGISRPTIGAFEFSNTGAFLILCVVLFGIVYAICSFISRSSLGRVLKGIREDEDALKVFGYRTQHYKLFVFVVCAMISAVAGGLFASYIRFIDPSTFTVHEMILVIASIILGGLANLRGSVIGAVLLIFLPELMRFIGFPDEIAAQMRQVVYGLLLVVLMMKRPQGIMGEYKL